MDGHECAKLETEALIVRYVCTYVSFAVQDLVQTHLRNGCVIIFLLLFSLALIRQECYFCCLMLLFLSRSTRQEISKSLPVRNLLPAYLKCYDHIASQGKVSITLWEIFLFVVIFVCHCFCCSCCFCGTYYFCCLLCCCFCGTCIGCYYLWFVVLLLLLLLMLLLFSGLCSSPTGHAPSNCQTDDQGRPRTP